MKAKGKPLLLRSINNVLEFGKHKGETITQVMKKDPNWLHWALQNIPEFKLNRNALLLLPKATRVIWYDDPDSGGPDVDSDYDRELNYGDRYDD